MINALRAAIMAGAGALLSGDDATERSKSFGPNLFKASRLLFCKRAADFCLYKPLLYLQNCTLMLPRGRVGSAKGAAGESAARMIAYGCPCFRSRLVRSV
jgi:hypothetical protein